PRLRVQGCGDGQAASEHAALERVELAEDARAEDRAERRPHEAVERRAGGVVGAGVTLVVVGEAEETLAEGERIEPADGRLDLLGREAAGERGAVERAAAAVVLEKDAAGRLIGRDASGADAGARWVLGVVVGIALVEPQSWIAKPGFEDRRDLVAPRQDGGLLEEIDVASVLAARILEW